jgi:hypothetical protein
MQRSAGAELAHNTAVRSKRKLFLLMQRFATAASLTTKNYAYSLYQARRSSAPPIMFVMTMRINMALDV